MPDAKPPMRDFEVALDVNGAVQVFNVHAAYGMRRSTNDAQYDGFTVFKDNDGKIVFEVQSSRLAYIRTLPSKDAPAHIPALRLGDRVRFGDFRESYELVDIERSEGFKVKFSFEAA